MYDSLLGSPVDLALLRASLRDISIDLYIRDGTSADLTLLNYLKGHAHVVLSFTDFTVHRSWRLTGCPIFLSGRVNKIAQLKRLEKRAIPVPPWCEFGTLGQLPSDLGSPIVVKNSSIHANGGKGIWLIDSAKFDRRELLREAKSRGVTEFFLQKYINTGEHATSFRIQCFLGIPIFCLKMEKAIRNRIGNLEDASDSFITNVSAKIERSLFNDPSILDLGSKSAQSFQEKAFVGIDVVRDENSGELFVLEVNIGNCWNYSNIQGIRRVVLGLPEMMAQFDAYKKMAARLSAVLTLPDTSKKR